MLQYILRRLLWMIPTLLGISIVVFGLIHLAPGDPAAVKFSGMASGESQVGANEEDMIRKFRERHLLDQPLWKQYVHYLGPFNLGPKGHSWFGGSGDDPWNGILVGDLGNEFRRPTVEIAGEVVQRLKVTVPLALISIVVSYLLALPIGIYSSVRRGSVLDVTSAVLLFLLYAVPTFWAGLMLQLLFGKGMWDLLPVLGLHDKDADDLGRVAYWIDLGKHLILPVVCYSYASLAYLSRQMRVGMVETMSQDYIRTARAKGLSEKVVVLKHALRNSVIPILTLLAAILPILVGGSIIIESVFDIPGMGKYAYEGLLLREYNVIMAVTLISALMTIVGILLSDITYALVDPRIRYD